jgi:myosin heavy subunit
MEVNFNERFHIKGCNITTYLLEKSRVVNQAQTERNFHSFYMLLAGASKALRHELDLRPPDQFHYLACSGCVDIPHRSEERMFHELEEAMLDMRIEASAQRQIFGVLAGILHLGNVAFHPCRDVEGGSQVASMADLKRVAALLGVGAAGLAKSLCSKEASFQAGVCVCTCLHGSPR